jgi:hypothetical protein
LIGAGILFVAACIVLVMIVRTGRWAYRNIKDE